MSEPEPRERTVPWGRRPRRRELARVRRTSVIGAGSFGTALAVLLVRAGLRVTLHARSEEQAQTLMRERENKRYLPGVELPAQLLVEPSLASLPRADLVFLAVPSSALAQLIASLAGGNVSPQAAVVSVAKGLVAPDGLPPTIALERALGTERVASLGGPAHAQEMVHAGAALVAASAQRELAQLLAEVLTRAGVVCEVSNDPVGVEVAGAAKNAAALAAGATEAQGANAAGAAAGHIFAEVWRWAEPLGAHPETLIGLAGTGDLLATALAPESRNRRAGELLAAGVPPARSPGASNRPSRHWSRSRCSRGRSSRQASVRP